MTSKSQTGRESIERKIDANFGSSWFLGITVTLLFYAFIPYSPICTADVQRYFLANGIEYAITGLFFVAACSLFKKWKRIPVERSALQGGLLDGLSVDFNDGADGCAMKIESHFEVAAKHLKDTMFVRRVRASCQYVLCRRSTDHIESHLKNLADLDEKRLNHSDSLVRTITWTIPMLGILGTIFLFTRSSTNLTSSIMESSLSNAFDTTVLSLALSAILVIGKLLVALPERQLLTEVQDVAINLLFRLFPVGQVVEPSPLRLAEQQTANQMLACSEKMIQGQMSLWQASLENLRERWSSTLSQQQDALVQALQTGLSYALTDHSRQLEHSRSEFLTAFQQASESISTQLVESRSALIEQQQRGNEQIIQTWQQFRTEITKTRDEHARQLALLTQAIAAEVGAWQNQLQSSTELMSHQFQELRSQGEVFLKITENESELVRLEQRLAENLEAVRVVESLDFTLMNLNAAVNLLTSRVKSNAA